MPKSRGFTLIELLVVIAILAILSVVAMASYGKVQSRGRDVQRLNDAKKLVFLIELYRSENGSYPDGTESNPCSSSFSGGACSSWRSGNACNGIWIPEVDTADYGGPTGNLPCDPQNVWRTSPYRNVTYAYISSGSDYCLEIPQENNATGSKFYNRFSGTIWYLRFGPKGPSSGLCT